MDLLITLQITADAEDLAWSLQRHLRQAGGPWTVEPLDHSDTVRVHVPETPGLQGLIGPVFQWLLPRPGVRAVTLTPPNGEQVVVSAEDATQSPPEPVYPPLQEPGDEAPAEEEYTDTLPSGRRDAPHSVTPPGPVIDPGDDWPQES
ncbi:hypothetical protein [Streptomyces sp. N35]|uniref:hypothetical protein n=1 Tax=Streptomyces sp. N35 TaxID=2795730 RepID=UPI0018F381A9|nr:hypothetical protein [Streptomyces sp. N35]